MHTHIYIIYTHSCKYIHVCAEEKGRHREIERGETKDERLGEGAPKTITGVKIGVNAHFKGFRPQGEPLLALLVGSLSVTLSVGRESGGLLRGAAGGP